MPEACLTLPKRWCAGPILIPFEARLLQNDNADSVTCPVSINGKDYLKARNPFGAPWIYFSVPNGIYLLGRHIEIEVELLLPTQFEIWIEYDSTDARTVVVPEMPGAFKRSDSRISAAAEQVRSFRFVLEDACFLRRRINGNDFRVVIAAPAGTSIYCSQVEIFESNGSALTTPIESADLDRSLRFLRSGVAVPHAVPDPIQYFSELDGGEEFDGFEVLRPDISWVVEDVEANGVMDADCVHDEYHKANRLNPRLSNLLGNISQTFRSKPVFSIVVPVFNGSPCFLNAMIDSVKAQIYPFWQLCIVDDASDDKQTLDFLHALPPSEGMALTFHDKNLNISNACNSAMRLATGDFVVFLDQDDMLAPNALFELARTLQKFPDTDVIYTDEDKVDRKDTFYDPFFKPDWSEVLFLGYNYLNHLTCIRRSLVEQIGGFRTGLEGAQDYDLLLRVTELTSNIQHIPKILYHWRAIPGSTAYETGAKPFMVAVARRALEEALVRRGIHATVYNPNIAISCDVPLHHLEWPDLGPRVEIIIPNFNNSEILAACIASIKKKTTYRNYSINIVDNCSDDHRTIRYIQSLQSDAIRVTTFRNDAKGFSFAALCNDAVSRSKAELVLLLNNDTEVLEPKWLSRMVGYLTCFEAGAVGARLLYPDRRVQHAGINLNLGGGHIPCHSFADLPGDEPGYYFLAHTTREVAAVTGACLLVSRHDYLHVGGLDSTRYGVSMNDVDLCRKLWARGKSILYVAGAELIHHESFTRSCSDDPRELAEYRRQYLGDIDHFYSNNLSCYNSYVPHGHCMLDYEEYFPTKLRVLLFTHSLGYEGAPKTLIDMACHANNGYVFTPIVVSATDGPGIKTLEEASIPVVLFPVDDNPGLLSHWSSQAELNKAVSAMVRLIRDLNIDLVVSNVINSYWVIEAACQAEVANLFWIHESYNQRLLLRNIGSVGKEMCERALRSATSVLFVSSDSARLYQAYRPFKLPFIINNSVTEIPESQVLSRTGKLELITGLGASPDTKIILSLGTICDRKSQATLVRAAKNLFKNRDDFICVLVGFRDSLPYGRSLKQYVEACGLSEKVILVNETSDPEKYYLVADIFVSASLNESHSLTILEAMAYGLPIVSTRAYGVSEQLREHVNACLYDYGDVVTLQKHLNSLLDDPALRERFSRNSLEMTRYMQSTDEMFEKQMNLLSRTYQSCADSIYDTEFTVETA